MSIFAVVLQKKKKLSFYIILCLLLETFDFETYILRRNDYTEIFEFLISFASLQFLRHPFFAMSYT